MTRPNDLDLVRALCGDTVSTAEATSDLGADAELISIKKPSDPSPSWQVTVLDDDGTAD